MITQERLKELLSYSPSTGLFHWNIDVVPNVKKGQKAGYVRRGYIVITYQKKDYLAHRLAWLYVYGEYPNVIDHADGNPSNNKLANLKNGTQGDNRKNCALYNTSTTGYPGVTFQKKAGKYRAYIYHNYQNIHLGMFKTIEEAIYARKEAERKYNFSDSHGRVPATS